MPRKSKAIDQPAKTELFARTNRRKLNTVGAICSEQSKIYRAAASGTIPTDEAMRLSLLLRELRTSMEVAQAAATIDMPAGGFSSDLIVLSVPRGSLVDVKTGICTTPSGDPISLSPCEPFASTPSLEMLADQSRATVEPLPVHEVIDDGKVVALRPHSDDTTERP